MIFNQLDQGSLGGVGGQLPAGARAALPLLSPRGGHSLVVLLDFDVVFRVPDKGQQIFPGDLQIIKLSVGAHIAVFPQGVCFNFSINVPGGISGLIGG